MNSMAIGKAVSETSVDPIQTMFPAPNRIVCSACGTEQEPSSGRDSMRCVICSKALAEVATPARSATSLVAAVAGLLHHGPDSGVPAELAAVLATNARLSYFFRLLPVFLGVMLLGGWLLGPNAAQQAADLHAGIHERIEVLHGLALEYLHEHGTLPDGEAWRRSAQAGDLRFYDEWGKPYRYQRTPKGFSIGTYGRDGAPGGDGKDEDVVVEFGLAPSPAADSTVIAGTRSSG